MSSSDKLYGLGVSDGGYVESAASRALAFNASALGIAGGLLRYFDPSTNIPTIFVLEQQDGTRASTTAASRSSKTRAFRSAPVEKAGYQSQQVDLH